MPLLPHIDLVIIGADSRVVQGLLSLEQVRFGALVTYIAVVDSSAPAAAMTKRLPTLALSRITVNPSSTPITSASHTTVSLAYVGAVLRKNSRLIHWPFSRQRVNCSPNNAPSIWPSTTGRSRPDGAKGAPPKSNEPCRFFDRTGRCRWGANCSFLHGGRPAAAAVQSARDKAKNEEKKRDAASAASTPRAAAAVPADPDMAPN